MLVYYVNVIENVYVWTKFLEIVVAWKCFNFLSLLVALDSHYLFHPQRVFGIRSFFVCVRLAHMMSHICNMDW